MLKIGSHVRVLYAEFDPEIQFVNKVGTIKSRGADLGREFKGLYMVKFSNGKEYSFWDKQLKIEPKN